MGKKVTDPELIKKLNAMSGYDDDSNDLGNRSSDNSNNNDQSQSTLSALSHIPYNLAVGAGGGIQNLGHDILPSLINKFEPQGISQNIGEPIGEAASFMLGPEAAAAKGLSYLGKSIPALSRLTGEGVLALSKRLASNTAFGAVTEPEDRLKGAEKGLLTGAVGELIPGAMSGISKGAEFLYPRKYANDLAQSIKGSYQTAKQDASALYKPVTDALGKKSITNYPNYSEYRKLGDDIFKDYPAKLKDVHDEFMKNPNLKNAHELQSRIGKTLTTYTSKNEPQAAIEKLSKAKDYLQNDINRFLQTNNPDLLKQYKNAGQFYKENVIPYRGQKNIADIASSKVQTIKPNQLKESLRKLTEQEGLVPENHPLQRAYNDLSARIERGKALSGIGSLAAGSAIPGVGLIGGALGGHYLTPKLLDIATNPTLNRSVHRTMPYYDALVKSLIGAQTGNS